MLNFPLHVLSPGLLTYPAQAPTAFDHLKRREVLGVVVEGNERARCEELEHAVEPRPVVPQHKEPVALAHARRAADAQRPGAGAPRSGTPRSLIWQGCKHHSVPEAELPHMAGLSHIKIRR
mgnify:CR=1 FL=1